MKKLKLLLFFVFSTFFSFASFGQADGEVEMADVLRQDGKIYTVVIGLVIILTLMILLLLRVDRKIFHLEKQMSEEA